MKMRIRRSVAVSLACMGLTAMAPATAFARCPAIGSYTFLGSCAPRERCVKRVVNNIIYGANNEPSATIVYQFYRRTNFDWVYDGYDYGSCTL